MNKRKKYLLLAVIALIILSIGAWLLLKTTNPAPSEENTANMLGSVDAENLTTSGDSKVSWPEAISILRSGEVRQVSQLHNLKVTIQMNNGDQITTTEPAIDEVIEELKLCGKTCENIIIATE